MSIDLKNKTKAFTLIELLVAIAIVGILSGFVIVSLNNATNAAKDAKRKSDIGAIQRSLMVYSVQNGDTYPSTDTYPCNIGSTCTNLATDLQPYLPNLPTDPNGGYYTYTYADGSFTIAATLSNGNTYSYTSSSGFWSCGDSVVYSGKSYATVLIGSQCWFQENLNVGTTILPPATSPTNNGIIEKWCNGADGDNHTTSGDCAVHGGLYSWDEAMGYVTTPGAQGICPAGWHIPTHDEWTTLERAVCTSGTCATDFPYDTTTIDWRGTNEGSKLSMFTLNGNNSSGFTILFSGYWNIAGTFYGRSAYADLWSSSQSESSAWLRLLSFNLASVNRHTDLKSYGCSVRCLKN
ncbi:MAG: FISUMP domain-containing protein [Candidatus Paceibacterota bacterium]